MIRNYPIAILFIVGTFLFSSPSIGQITELNTTPGSVSQGYSFLDDLVGYAQLFQAGPFPSYTLNKTTDGGQTWTQISLPGGATKVKAIAFSSNQTGYMVKENSTTNGDTIYKTTDGGTTWTNLSQTNPALGLYPELQFFSDQVGYIKIHRNYYYKTTDGGANWDTTNIGNLTPFNGDVQELHFFDQDHGIAGSHDGTFYYKGRVHITSDGGLTWKNITFPMLNGVIGGVKFTSTTTAYAAPIGWGASGMPIIYKTTDAGLSWDTLNLPVPSALIEDSEFTAMNFRDDLEGYIVINNKDTDVRHFYKTVDGGLNWTSFGTTSVPEISVLYLTANSGYASGSSGPFIRFDDPTGIVETDALEVAIYPNPVVAGNVLQLKGIQAGEKQVTLFSTNGQLIFQQEVSGVSAELVLPNSLPTGMYLLKVQAAESVKVVRLVVE